MQRFDNNASQVSGNDNSGLFACVVGDNDPTKDGNANESTCACLGVSAPVSNHTPVKSNQHTDTYSGWNYLYPAAAPHGDFW